MEGSGVTPRLRTVGDSSKIFPNKSMLCSVTLQRFVFEPSQMNSVLFGLSRSLLEEMCFSSSLAHSWNLRTTVDRSDTWTVQLCFPDKLQAFPGSFPANA